MFDTGDYREQFKALSQAQPAIEPIRKSLMAGVVDAARNGLVG